MEEMSRNFYKALGQYEEENYLYFYLKYYLAPVLTGLKPASTLNITATLKEKWIQYGESVMKRLGVDVYILRYKKNSTILLIYKKKALETLLEDRAINNYLRTLGYPVENLEEVLCFLVNRYSLVHCPHEVGILLGIPLEDVKAFSEDPYRPCLLQGYWRVYSNLEKAKTLFKAYDKVRMKVIEASI